MPNINTAATEQQHVHSLATFATILPASTSMPINCDACDVEHMYTMAHLRTLPQLHCQDCQDQRQFSAFELNILEKALNGMGYYLAKSAVL